MQINNDDGAVELELSQLCVFQICRGEIPIIYITPEKLSNWYDRLATLNSNSRLLYVAIDESHCVSEWGESLILRVLICFAISLISITTITATDMILSRHSCVCNRARFPTGIPTVASDTYDPATHPNHSVDCHCYRADTRRH